MMVAVIAILILFTAGPKSQFSPETAFSPPVGETRSDDEAMLRDKIYAVKEGNTQIRLIRWRNTLALIQAHPLGIGPGNYEFGYLPFRSAWQPDPEAREDLVVRSPHNGYLEAMAE